MSAEQKIIDPQPSTCKVYRLAQEVMRGPKPARWQIVHGIRLLNKYSYVKDMTVKEVIEALTMISDKDI